MTCQKQFCVETAITSLFVVNTCIIKLNLLFHDKLKKIFFNYKLQILLVKLGNEITVGVLTSLVVKYKKEII